MALPRARCLVAARRGALTSGSPRPSKCHAALGGAPRPLRAQRVTSRLAQAIAVVVMYDASLGCAHMPHPNFCYSDLV
jgi:hypothetical protein